MNTHTLFNLAVVSSLTLLAAGCGTPQPNTAAAPEESSSAAVSNSSAPAATNRPPVRPGKFQPSTDVLQAHFQATIYEVQAYSNRLNSIDGKALAKQAATADSLLSALSSYGPARVLYRFDQPVNVFAESLTMGSSEPLVTGSRTSQRGEAMNTVSYHQVGAIIRLSAQVPPKSAKRKGPDVTLAAELAVLATSDVEIVPGRKANTTRTLSLDNTEELTYGQPRVMLATSSTSTDEKQPPVLYVIRYVFNR